MARSLSATAKRAMFAQETEQVFLLLLTIVHPDIDTIRVVNNTQDITSGGQLFSAFKFEITLPEESEDRQPFMQLRIDNVDRRIVRAIRTITSPPTVQLDVVLASQPDTIEATLPDFTLRTVDYDVLLVEGRLTLDDILSEPYPEGTMNPQDFPGLF